MAIELQYVPKHRNGIGILLGQVQLVHKLHRRKEGVLALLRRGRMRRYARYHHVRAVIRRAYIICKVRIIKLCHSSFHFIRAYGDENFRLAGYGVGYRACLYAHGGSVFLAIGAVVYHLFGIYQRIACIGREAHIRRLLHLIIMMQAAHAAFFVAAQYQPYAALGLNSACLYRRQSEQRRKRGAFIVHGAAAVQAAVVNFRSIGRICPAFAFGHHVKMRQYAQLLLARAVVHRAAVAVKVFHFKAHLLGGIQRVLQALRRALAKGCAFPCAAIVAHRVYPNALLKLLHQLVLMLIYPFVRKNAHIKTSLEF